MIHDKRYYARTERFGRAELEAYQLKKLRVLLERCYASNPFYRDLWRRAGVAPDDIASLDDFRNRVPHIEKQDCLADQEEHSPLGRRLGVPLDTVRQVHLTSGTSGVGQEAWGLTQADVELSATGWLAQYHWMGLERGDVAFYSVPVAFFANGLSCDYAGRKMGMVSFNLFGMDKQLVFRLMERFQPHYLYGVFTMPSMGGSDEGPPPRERFHRVKALQAAMLSPTGLRSLSEAWGAPVYEMYGCTQASSVVGATCEASALVDGVAGIVHFLENHYIVECLDRDTGQPAQPGDECEVFLTTLDREASPAVRFRMHDKLHYVGAHECACGRPYHGYRAGSVGRWDDMMKVKGINLWPSTMDELVMLHPEVAEYRGTIEIDQARNREIMRLVVDFKPDVPETVREAFLNRLSDEVKSKTFVTPVVEEAASPLDKFLFKPTRWQDLRRARR